MRMQQHAASAAPSSDGSAPMLDAVAGCARASRCCARSGCTDRSRIADLLAPVHAQARPVAAGASHRPRQPRGRLSGKVGGRDRADPRRRVGQSRPLCAPNSPISTGSATATRPADRPTSCSRPERRSNASRGCATTASRRWSSPPISPTGSCRRWWRPRTGSIRAVLYRRPNIGAVSDAVVQIRAGSMGTLVPTGLDAPVQARARAGARARMSPCWSTSITCRAST